MGPPPPPLHFPAPTSNPPSTSILHFPSAPSSPSKRRQSTSHYQHHPSSPSHSSSDLEFQHSPSKKRLHRPSISLLERREKENKKEFEGRGMLFGDTTNAADVRPVSSLGFSKTKGEGGDEEEDVFAFGLGLGDGVAGTTSASLKGKKSRAAAGGKGATTNSNMVEVVLDPLMDPSIAKIQGGGVKGVEKKSSSRARNDTRSTGKAAAGTTEGKAVRMRTRSLSALTPAKPFTRSTKRKLA
ncbi:hypothetical protein K474DRAFT_1088090 [Panus rudis PR-1116 ss-1]|nr:hypothetical protein K474DRAFT_1088090 [Panus rudis PR-1116 ss-1]